MCLKGVYKASEVYHNSGSVGGVEANGSNENVDHALGDGLVLGNALVVHPTDVTLHGCHSIRCQRARFVRANGRRIAHRLARVQVTY